MLFFSPLSYAAATLDDVNNSINAVLSAIQSFAQFQLQVEQLRHNAEAQLYFQASPDTNWANKFYAWVGQSMFVNQSQIGLDSQIYTVSGQYYQNLMNNSANAAIFPTISNGTRSLQATLNIVNNIPLDDDSVQQNAANFNLDVILGQDILNDNAMITVNNFINTLSLAGVNFQQGYNKQRFLQYIKDNNQKGLQYLASMGAYAAGVSVGLSSLYQMAAKRYPQTSITNLQIKDNSGQQIQSKAQLERYLAERRVTSPDWYATMAAATPATVARETLFLLAEMRLQQYESQLQQERILATLAAIHLSANQSIGAYTLTSQQNIMNSQQ